jgi:2-oxoglutarate ferredoxin oxidoreductase subunit gamma
MLLGKIIAETAMREGKLVTWLPAYGAEVRGGTAHCMVIMADQEIGSPYIEQADAAIIMNGPSLKKFRSRLSQNALLIANSSMVESKELSGILAAARVSVAPFTEAAVELGNIKVANMIALGYYISRRPVIKASTISAVIADIAPQGKKDLIEINQQALRVGISLAKKKSSAKQFNNITI